MALNTRCTKCRGLLGPEDAVGAVTHPGLCFGCRERAARQAPAPSQHPSAVAGRQRKALAMAVVIDRSAVAQGLSPFDQAARIVIKSYEWSDRVWEDIGERALKPNGEHYERKEISQETRETVRQIYRGRAQAPVNRRAAS